MKAMPFALVRVALLFAVMIKTACGVEPTSKVKEILGFYCLECHDQASTKGDFNLEQLLEEDRFDGTLMFENLLSGKMPPAGKDQPEEKEKRAVLDWLARRQMPSIPPPFRRLSRHEFSFSLNDLLGTNLDLTGRIPEDRGTHRFDSNRSIQLSREMLDSYFAVADEMIESALPAKGFPAERVWVTNTVRDSHETYRIFHRPYRD